MEVIFPEEKSTGEATFLSLPQKPLYADFINTLPRTFRRMAKNYSSTHIVTSEATGMSLLP